MLSREFGSAPTGVNRKFDQSYEVLSHRLTAPFLQNTFVRRFERIVQKNGTWKSCPNCA
jgi:hypothetical protein